MTQRGWKLAAMWLAGMALGTGLVAITSPLFVRSYVVLQHDPLRDVWTLPPGAAYRWRSEGYATTAIGPHGMPGKRVLENEDDRMRVALWGDSQAEGVCVADRDKIFAQAETLADDSISVLPLARSGEDASDWIAQMRAVERHLGVDAHVLLIVDLPDLQAASQGKAAGPQPEELRAARNTITRLLPAFVIHTARNLLFESDQSTPRQLDFRVGPRPRPQTPTSVPPSDSSFTWNRAIEQLKQARTQPVIVIYAPPLPQIVGGRIVSADPLASAFVEMRTVARQSGITVVDAREALRRLAADGSWPHGFHNGQIGVGHLNSRGNAVIAGLLVEAVRRTATSPVMNGD